MRRHVGQLWVGSTHPCRTGLATQAWNGASAVKWLVSKVQRPYMPKNVEWPVMTDAVAPSNEPE